ncbi:MAG: Maf family nucleotide pyrophosphatase [Bacteroidota bacterium]
MINFKSGILKLKFKIILASKSPRRQQLLKALGLKFDVRTKKVREDYPSDLKREQIALYLCELKANAFENELDKNTLLITADTIVWIDDKTINKPADFDEAVQVLEMLSGRMHEVITGVCFKTRQKTRSFFVVTKVYFKKLTNQEITYYVKNFKPYDKAGAYGIQEWIGSVGIKKIEGSYFNVVGLPIKELYKELMEFSI